MTALVLVDHGSRRRESNEMLEVVADMVRRALTYPIVEPAHMELAQPDIATSFRRCVEQGATTVIVHPFFLFPGRHWSEDIPSLVAQAAEDFPSVRYLVSAPLGAHDLMTRIVDDRVKDCVTAANSGEVDCQFCEASQQCQWRTGGASQSAS